MVIAIKKNVREVRLSWKKGVDKTELLKNHSEAAELQSRWQELLPLMESLNLKSSMPATTVTPPPKLNFKLNRDQTSASSDRSKDPIPKYWGPGKKVNEPKAPQISDYGTKWKKLEGGQESYGLKPDQSWADIKHKLIQTVIKETEEEVDQSQPYNDYEEMKKNIERVILRYARLRWQ